MAEIATVKVEFDPSKCDALIEVFQGLDERITILEEKQHERDNTSKWDALIEVVQDLDKRITILEVKQHEGDDTD
jgi:hypothetical protein